MSTANESRPVRSVRPRRTKSIVALVAAGAIGIGIGVGPHLFDSGASASKVFDSQHSVRTVHLPGRGATLDVAELNRRLHNAAAPTGPAAPDARAAVQRFVAGEIRRDDALSYAQLSAADRATFPTVSTWTQHEAQNAHLARAAITTVIVRGSAADVGAQLNLRAVLDEISGLVPARAHAMYHVVREDNGWRIALSSSRVIYDYLADTNARAAATAWLAARTQCTSASRWQWRDRLYGDGADNFASHLCDRTREGRTVATDPARPLDDSDAAAPLLAAFGPDAGLWARVVPVHRGAVSNQLVLAPVGEQWLVIAVLRSSPAGGQG